MEPFGKSFCGNKLSEMGSFLKISLDETNVEYKIYKNILYIIYQCKYDSIAGVG